MIKVFRLRRVGIITLVVALVSVAFFALFIGKGVNAQSSSTCTDSDKGKNYYVKGTAKADVNSATDVCGPGSSTIPQGHELIERNCKDGFVSDEHYNCPGGCSDGACVAYYDTDGKDYFTKGITYFKGDKNDEESCLNSTRKEPAYRTEEGPYLFEIWVERGIVNSEAYKCPNGCKDGACLKISECESAGYKCTSAVRGCGHYNQLDYSCGSGVGVACCEKIPYCGDGVCFTHELPGYGETPQNCPTDCKPTCTDSDNGKDYFVKGETADFGDTKKDVCFDSNTVTEFYCEQAEGQTRPSRAAEQKECEYGCNGGICVAEPSEEDIDRLEKQKKIQELITGAKGITGMLNSINVMQRVFMQLAKQGVSMPEELAQTIARVKELGPEMNDLKNRNAENVTDEEAETLTDNASELCEIGPTLEEWGDKIPQFLQIGAKMKQMTKDLKRAKSDVKLAVKAAARSKFGISDKVDELNGAFEALKTTLDDAIASTDFDEKDGKINEFYDQFQDIYDTIGVINALQNTAKAKVEWGKRVKTNARTVSQLESAGSDVAELAAKNDEVKAKVDELNAALAKKPISRDEVKWIFEDLKSRQAEFSDIADQLRGVKSSLPKVQTVKFDTSQFKNFGAFSQFCGVPQEEDN